MSNNNNKFNNDCLKMIIEELHDDSNSLYSCLQICHLWYNIVVPILWQNPWKFLKDRNDSAREFLNTIYFLLPEGSKNYLKDQGVNLEISHYKKYEKPFSDYIQNIKCIKCIKWKLDINSLCDTGSHNYRHDKFKQEIYKLFISKCSSLKCLDITGVNQPLHEFPRAENSLSNLCELHCSSADDLSILSGLAKICRLIKKLCIFYERSNPGLAELINQQKALKYIKISAGMLNTRNDSHQLENQYQQVYQMIIKHSDTLEYVEIPIEIIQSTFPELNNLRKLLLDGQSMYDVDLEDQLVFSTYPKLETLYLNRVLISTAKKVIMNTTNLQIIWMDNIYFSEDQDQARNFIQIISQYCPNLKYIKVLLKDQYLEELQELLTKLHCLEGLYIDADPQESNCRGDELLDILIESAPISLFKIQINDFKFKTKKFDLLFTKWKGQKSLCLYIHNVKVEVEDDFENTFENLIEKYKVKKYEKLNFIDDYKEFE